MAGKDGLPFRQPGMTGNVVAGGTRQRISLHSHAIAMFCTLGATAVGFFFLVQVPCLGICQTVQIGPINPNFCATAEHIAPNLKLDQTTRVKGRVVDQTGAPFKKSRVELRKYMSEKRQIAMKTVLTDEDGRFQLGSIKSGKYRLLPSPSRAFRQPELLDCPNRPDCQLNITLVVNPTDLPESNCPIR